MKKSGQKKQRILGIDPGFGRIGFGIIEGSGRDWKPVAHGCIETSSKKGFIERLEDVHTVLKYIIKKYHPTHSAVEELFFYKNVKTAIDVGQARGVILLTLREAGLPISEYTPLQIKQSITGYGRAEKGQLQRMVRMMLGIKKAITPDDAADALAIALTCGASFKMEYMGSK